MFQEFNINNLEDKPNQLQKLIDNNLQAIEKLKKVEDKTYQNFIRPYMEIAQELHEFVTPLFHIDSVKHTDASSQLYSQILPIVSQYSSQLSFDEEVYEATKDILNKEQNKLQTAQVKVLQDMIRDFKLGGCGLDKHDKDRLQKIDLRLQELSHNFSQNLLEATNNYEMIIQDKSNIEGIPKSDLDIARFEEDGVEKYRFGLQMPSYLAYITYGPNRLLREEIYKAYSTRASKNSVIIDEILRLKLEKAQILSFDNYAKLSIASKSAKSVEDVINFLYDIASKTKPKAIQEFKELQEFANSLGFEDTLQSYDIPYFSEKLKESRYGIDEELYKPYFEKNSVLEGLFEFLYKIFDIKFIKTIHKGWDEKVDVYDVAYKDRVIARVFIDLEVRDDKRGGAWMDDWQSRYKDSNNNLHLPSAYLVTNFAPSKEGIKSLLRHEDVVTLFHEMGHVLHHILSVVDEAFVSGVNGVDWDVVEFPSQFLEYFAYEPEVLKIFAKHYQNGEVLSDEMIAKLKKAKNFQSSLATLRQIEFALFDIKLYSKLYQNSAVSQLLDEIRKEIAVVIPPSYNMFPNSFAHIFAGGYSAGYYSYKWAEVLSADAFYLFIENGIFNQELSKKYKDLILGLGGSVDMNELFLQLSGRVPKVDSLLKIDGIIE
jgi:oligopeptidase A